VGKAVSDAASSAGCGVVDLCCSGYNLETVAEGWLAILSGLIGVEVEPEGRGIPRRTNPRLLEATNSVIEELGNRLSDYWTLD